MDTPSHKVRIKNSNSERVVTNITNVYRFNAQRVTFTFWKREELQITWLWQKTLPPPQKLVCKRYWGDYQTTQASIWSSSHGRQANKCTRAKNRDGTCVNKWCATFAPPFFFREWHYDEMRMLVRNVSRRKRQKDEDDPIGSNKTSRKAQKIQSPPLFISQNKRKVSQPIAESYKVDD